MNWKVVPALSLVVAGFAHAATPRKFVAVSVGNALSKLKAAESKVDDLPGALKKATEGIAEARGNLKEAQKQLAEAQKSIDEASAKASSSAAKCAETTVKLNALQTPTKGELVKNNEDQCKSFEDIKALMVKTSANNAKTNSELTKLEPTLAAVASALDKAKDMPSTGKLNTVVGVLEGVLKVNEAAMPNVPDIKELKPIE